MDNRPVGIFDSGVGGLTCASYIMSMMPKERMIFFGDTGRAPYGSRSPAEVERFSLEIADFLMEQGVKMIVIACNTATAAALDRLKDKYKGVPVIGAVRPTAEAVSALCGKESSLGNIGLIATKVTVNSKIYEREIHKLNKNLNIYGKACPVLVPLIEEGITDNEIMDLTIKYYLDDFIIKNKITDLILGCTHYPIIAHRIKRIYPDVSLISSSKEEASSVCTELKKRELEAEEHEGDNLFFASDLTDTFVRMVNMISKKNKAGSKIYLRNNFDMIIK